MDRRALALLRLGFGLLTFAAIGAQLLSLVDVGSFDPVNYFSYFTILSNIFGAVLLLVGAARWRAGHDATKDLLRGAAVVYLSVTFIVFAVLLSNTDVDLATPWVNTVLHEVIPIVVFLDWLVDPPEVRFSMLQVAWWLTFPIVWVVYVLIRGALVGKYPYPFLDPANGGYASVAVYVVGIAILVIIVSAAVHWLGNVSRARRTARA
ncbi:MAG: Pr6Pr family membrane protein [Chloroflexota bacterium]